MKNFYLVVVIAGSFLCTLNSQTANDQTCKDENSSHTLDILTYFIDDNRFEPDRIESGIQNIHIGDVIRLTASENSDMCSQLKQTSAFVNAPPTGINEISFFQSSDRRFIVYFFIDTLPSDNGLTLYSGPIGIIRIFDENLQHVLSVSIK